MKIWILDRKIGFTYCLIAILLVSFVYLAKNKNYFVSAENQEMPIRFVDRNDKLVSISFDTEVSDKHVKEILNLLEAKKITSTFFLVGDWIKKYPESTKAIFNKGHEIANHTNTHKKLKRLECEKIREEIKSCEEKIIEITKKKPTLLRPPYGECSNNVIDIAKEMGYKVVHWNVDSEDWKCRSNDNTLTNFTSGSIVLFHLNSKNNIDLVTKTIDKIQSEGFKIVPISSLIYKDNYTIDKEGKQIRKVESCPKKEEKQINSDEGEKTTENNKKPTTQQDNLSKQSDSNNMNQNQTTEPKPKITEESNPSDTLQNIKKEKCECKEKQPQEMGSSDSIKKASGAGSESPNKTSGNGGNQ